MEPIVTIGIGIAAVTGLTLGYMTYEEHAFRKRYTGKVVKINDRKVFEAVRASGAQKVLNKMSFGVISAQNKQLLSQLKPVAEGVVVGFSSGLYITWNRKVQVKLLGSNVIKEFLLKDFIIFDLVDECEDLVDHLENMTSATKALFMAAKPAMVAKAMEGATNEIANFEKNLAKAPAREQEAWAKLPLEEQTRLRTAAILRAQFESLAAGVDMSQLSPEILKLLDATKQQVLRANAPTKVVELVDNVVETGVRLGVDGTIKALKVAKEGMVFKLHTENEDISTYFSNLFTGEAPKAASA